MGIKRVLCGDKLEYTKKQHEKLKRLYGQDYFEGFNDPHFLIKPNSELQRTLNPDILIIEDELTWITSYIKELVGEDSALNIIACTDTDATNLFLLFQTEDSLRHIKMVLFDFDLMEYINQDQEQARSTKSLYENLSSKLNHNLRIYGLTSYEGGYGTKDFKDIENYLRKSGDDVFNKSQVVEDKMFIANLFRNALAYYAYPEEDQIIQQHLITNGRGNSLSSKHSGQKPNQKKYNGASIHLKRIEEGLTEHYSSNDKFEKTKDFGSIKNSRGKPYRQYQSFISLIEDNAEAIIYIINSEEGKKYPNFSRLVRNGVFDTQLKK